RPGGPRPPGLGVDRRDRVGGGRPIRRRPGQPAGRQRSRRRRRRGDRRRAAGGRRAPRVGRRHRWAGARGGRGGGAGRRVLVAVAGAPVPVVVGGRVAPFNGPVTLPAGVELVLGRPAL